VLIVDVVV